jgi:hypothetical protein
VQGPIKTVLSAVNGTVKYVFQMGEFFSKMFVYGFTTVSFPNILVTDNADNVIVNTSTGTYIDYAMPSLRDLALCSLVKATNIGSISSLWSCDGDSILFSDPCQGSTPWPFIKCYEKDVVELDLPDGTGIIGT